MELSLPKCIPLRERSIFMHLKKTFPDFPLQFSNIANIKKLFRIVAGDILSNKFEKSSTSDSNFIFKFLINYSNDNEVSTSYLVCLIKTYNFILGIKRNQRY